ncbi:peptidase [Kordiimonas sediminis]|uniref:Peptidase n=1 Tax=Kordiimonas sediminis TaxID=1735581 RepID=A0A919E472_9PROT|nr:peptidase [Kordiimonas sediminis]
MAAYTDFKDRLIPNWISVALICLYAILAGMLIWFADSSILPTLVYPFGVAAAVFAFGLFLFAKNIMGGGDIKLLTAMSLFAGTRFIGSFLIYTAIIGGIIALVMVIYKQIVQDSGKKASQVPYGIAISLSGVWVLYQKYIQFDQ